MLRTAVIGASGYSGAELTGLLHEHPDVDLVGLFGSEARSEGIVPQPFSEIHPRWRNQIDLPVQPMSVDAVLVLAPDAVFLATPHAVSHELAAQFVEQGITVFDLSGAYRLGTAALVQQHYEFAHEHEDLLECAAYGLPERNESAIRDASLIALPGCYPTSIILPIAPLIESGAVAAGTPIIADSTSGISGAGRAPALKSMFCEVSYAPYAVLSHRHAPEICLHSGGDVIFTPHVAPFDRGLVSTIHITLEKSWTDSTVRSCLEQSYADAPFVRLLPDGQWPSVASVRGTNCCDIGFAVDEEHRHLIVISAIDNLLKGAAGQAVQCFNIRFGFPQDVGLPGGRSCSMVN